MQRQHPHQWVTFGKYKGQPVAEIMKDTQYLEFLEKQTWWIEHKNCRAIQQYWAAKENTWRPTRGHRDWGDDFCVICLERCTDNSNGHELYDRFVLNIISGPGDELLGGEIEVEDDKHYKQRVAVCDICRDTSRDECNELVWAEYCGTVAKLGDFDYYVS